VGLGLLAWEAWADCACGPTYRKYDGNAGVIADIQGWFVFIVSVYLRFC
jgi:hypothetical protein